MQSSTRRRRQEIRPTGPRCQQGGEGQQVPDNIVGGTSYVKTVVVKTAPGYPPNPLSTGTWTVVATFCARPGGTDWPYCRRITGATERGSIGGPGVAGKLWRTSRRCAGDVRTFAR